MIDNELQLLAYDNSDYNNLTINDLLKQGKIIHIIFGSVIYIIIEIESVTIQKKLIAGVKIRYLLLSNYEEHICGLRDTKEIFLNLI